jgi:hypothetical protein
MPKSSPAVTAVSEIPSVAATVLSAVLPNRLPMPRAAQANGPATDLSANSETAASRRARS